MRGTFGRRLDAIGVRRKRERHLWASGAVNAGREEASEELLGVELTQSRRGGSVGGTFERRVDAIEVGRRCEKHIRASG